MDSIHKACTIEVSLWKVYGLWDLEKPMLMNLFLMIKLPWLVVSPCRLCRTANAAYAHQGKMGLFVNILISNVWQVMISLLYIGHNALLSCMMVAKEWFGFATHRKTLRVSAPRGIQRSSYTLSMPFRYGIPMMLIFSMEHWILSLKLRSSFE